MSRPRDPTSFLQLRGQAAAIALSGLAALALIVNAAIAVADLHRVAAADAEVDHANQVLLELNGLLTSVHEAERMQRSYLLTGDPRFRSAYADARGAVDLHLLRVGARVSGDPSHAPRLAALRPVLAQRMDVLDRGVELRDGPDGFDRSVALVRSGWGPKLMDQVQDQVEAMAAVEEVRQLDGARRSARAHRTGLAAILLGLAASLALLTGATRAFRGRLRERGLAAAQLHDEKERLRTTLTSIGDGVVVADASGRIEMLNEAAREITAAAPDVVGRRLEEVLRRVSEDSRRPMECPVRAVVREGKPVGPSDRVLLVRPDGTEVPIEENAAPVRDVDGRLSGVVLVLRDDRARREAERELARRAELLEEQDRRKDEFLAVLSHELRNPLAAIRNGAAVLALVEPGSAQAVRAREIVERQSGHLARLVDDLLDVARIASGKIRIERVRIDVEEVVRRAVEDARPSVEARQLTLELHADAGPLWVDGDAMRIAQVTANLLLNAAKFTPAGGRVEVRVRREGDRAVLRVRDSGIGMDGALVERLFQPFVQAEDSLHRSAGGLGLGLAIARSIVELHGGTIRGASDGPGRGAEFEVRLPLRDAAHTPPRHPPRARPAADGGKRVLVIEDNEDSAETLRDILELQGHEVAIARDGPEGLARARAADPDVVLCDVGIPGLDGYEVARRLRAAGSRARLVALTGYAAAEDVARARQAGFDAHLAKPPDLDRLERLIAPATSAGAVDPGMA